jgi:NIPSNAP.
VIFALNTFDGFAPSHHVYELRLYHVNQGEMDALRARFGDHTDAIFKRHNMKSVDYWVPNSRVSSAAAIARHALAF